MSEQIAQASAECHQALEVCYTLLPVARLKVKLAGSLARILCRGCLTLHHIMLRLPTVRCRPNRVTTVHLDTHPQNTIYAPFVI